MTKKLIVTCIAMAAFAAFLVAPSLASAANSPVITHPTGTVLNPETGECTGVKKTICITATNVGELVMTDAAGGHLVTCSTATLTGYLTKNANNTVEGDVHTATFSGTGAVGVNGLKECTGSFGNIAVTTNVANGVPWCVRSTATMAEHEFQTRGGNCTEAAREIRFILDSTTIGECTYGRAAASPVVGKYLTDTEPTAGQDAVVTIEKQKFEKKAGSILCPSEGFLDFKFTLETDETTAKPLYFS